MKKGNVKLQRKNQSIKVLELGLKNDERGGKGKKKRGIKRVKKRGKALAGSVYSMESTYPKVVRLLLLLPWGSKLNVVIQTQENRQKQQTKHPHEA